MITIGLLMAIATKQRASDLNSLVLIFLSVYDITASTLSEKGDQECPGHDFLMSQSAVRYVSSKSEA